MHIGFLSPTWPAGEFPNGIVTYVNAMRRGLLEQGHRVSVFTGHVRADQTDKGIYLIRRSPLGRASDFVAQHIFRRDDFVYRRSYAIADSIKRVHEEDPFDILEIEESFGWVAMITQRVDIPIVVKLHGPAFLHQVEEELSTPFGKEKVRREGLALATSPVVMSPSRSTLDKTIARYSLTPKIARQVVNPITLGSDAVLWDLDVCAKDTVLFVGRFDKVKGGDLMLIAFKDLLLRRPDLKLIFVGPDNGLLLANGERMYFEEFMASLNDPLLARSVTYRGRLGPAEVTTLRTTALVTVVASRHENQPYTILEAMLQGCPVVSTDISGSNESVKHDVTGLLARADDPLDLSHQIERIVDKPSLGRALGLAAREYVIRTHATANVVSQTLDVYRQAISLAAAGPHRQV